MFKTELQARQGCFNTYKREDTANCYHVIPGASSSLCICIPVPSPASLPSTHTSTHSVDPWDLPPSSPDQSGILSSRRLPSPLAPWAHLLCPLECSPSGSIFWNPYLSLSTTGIHLRLETTLVIFISLETSIMPTLPQILKEWMNEVQNWARDKENIRIWEAWLENSQSGSSEVDSRNFLLRLIYSPPPAVLPTPPAYIKVLLLAMSTG